MAVVEIAKIQIRRGDARTDGMPQLDTGEFGWAISGTQPESTTPELYIGNKVDDGAPSTSNTRILTSLDLPNIFGSSITTSTYYYSGHRPEGIDIYTYDGDTYNTRTVKEKLDDNVSFFDFLTKEEYLSDSESTDLTTRLQRAVDQLYLNSDKNQPRGRVQLRIPAGIYYVSGTIYLPPYASIIGDGIDKTVIITTSGDTVFQFVDLESNPGSYHLLGNMNSIASPKAIVISDLTIKTLPLVSVSECLPFIYADCSEDTIIKNVKFIGPSDNYSSSNTDQVGVDIRGAGGITSRNLVITGCIFQSLCYGIRSNYDTKNSLIDGNKFENLHRGIVYNETPNDVLGPSGSRITRNTFQTISREAVKVHGTSTEYTNHFLSDNLFSNVGNNSSYNNLGAGDLGGQVSNVVFFGTSGNISDYDYYTRSTLINSTTSYYTSIPAIYGHISLVDHRVVSLNISPGNGTVAKIPRTSSEQTMNIKLQYQITASGISRWGELVLVCAENTLISRPPLFPQVPLTDSYTFTGTVDSTGVTFDAQYVSANNIIEIKYLNNTVTGTLTYQINQYY